MPGISQSLPAAGIAPVAPLAQVAEVAFRPHNMLEAGIGDASCRSSDVKSFSDLGR
jgi:hypothetical protein